MKNTHRLWVLCLLVLLNINANGQLKIDQYINRNLPATPTEASLGTYGNTEINTYRGLPSISIPIYDYKCKNLSIPVMLNYDASGIRVEGNVGWLGTGWNISAGGKITVQVRQYADRHVFAGGGKRKYLNYAAWQSSVDRSSLNPDDTHYPAFEDFDLEPDVYSFDFCGISGKFMLDENGNAKCYSTNRVKIKANYDVVNPYPSASGLNDIIDTWTITDDQGIEYNFKAAEIIVPSFPTPSSLTRFDFTFKSKSYISTWYLTSIEDKKNGAIIYLNYTSYYYNLNNKPSENSVRLTVNLDEDINIAMNENFFKEEIVQIRTYVEGKALASISSNLSPFIVNFQSNMTQAYYGFINDFLLNNIILKENVNNTELRRFNFNYDYHNQSGGAQRRKLVSIEEKDNLTNSKWYRFEYNESVALPPSNSYAVDEWGYYNGKSDNSVSMPKLSILNPRFYNSPPTGYITDLPFINRDNLPCSSLKTLYFDHNCQEAIPVHTIANPTNDVVWTQYLCIPPDGFGKYTVNGADRSISAPDMQGGVLTKIYYPTGGSTSFEYEPNEVGYVQNKRFMRNEYGDVDKSYHLYFNEASTYTTTVYIPEGQTVGLNYSFSSTTTEPYTGTITINNISNNNELCWSKSFNYSDLGSSSWSCPAELDVLMSNIKCSNGNERISLNSGTYRITMSKPNTTHHALTFHIGYKEIKKTLNSKTVGGLRVAKIIDSDGISSKNDVIRKIKYTIKEEDETFERSSGVLDHLPVYFRPFQYSYAVQTIFFSNDLVRAINENVGYRHVEIIKNDGSKTAYDYNTLFDYPSLLPTNSFFTGPYFDNNNFPYPPDDDRSFITGQLKKKTEYNTTGKVVLETNNDYELHTFWDEIHGNSYIKDIKLYDGGFVSYDTYSTYYRLTLGYSLLKEVVNKTYDLQGNNPITVTTTNQIDLLRRLVYQTDATNSKGETESTITLYQDDFPIEDPAMSSFKAKNVLKLPVEVVNYKKDKSGNLFVTSGLAFKYNSSCLLTNVYKLETANPIPIEDFAFSNAQHKGDIPPNVTNIYFSVDNLDERYNRTPVISVDEYDLYGNVIQYHDNKGKFSTILYDIRNQNPIAFIENAKADEVFYLGFEDYESYSTQITVTSSSSKTGLSSCVGSYTVNLPKPGKYQLTYWAKDASGKWNFKSEIITTQKTIGAGYTAVDEIRLCPVNALIKTYTYDSFGFLTTVTDERNVTHNYDYDGLGRLKNIKDFNSNILKSFEYHFRSNQ